MSKINKKKKKQWKNCETGQGVQSYGGGFVKSSDTAVSLVYTQSGLEMSYSNSLNIAEES